jgi:long-chain acyl-CoA synthetase
MKMTYDHPAEMIFRRAERYKNRSAIQYRDPKGKWQKISWADFAEEVRLTSQAMIEFGVEAHEHVGICAQNMPECFFTDYGAYGIRAVSVPMYATCSPAQIEYIVRDAGIRFLFVGEQLQYNNAFRVQQANRERLKRLIIFDPAVVRNPDDTTSVFMRDFLRLGDHAPAETEVKIRRSHAVPEDLAMIVYTSGTTGESKGVMLTHANLLEVLRIHDLRLPEVNDGDLSMCFLPLTHIFEKAWACYCFHKGVEVAVNRDARKILETLPEVCPTLMCNVPRFWEKVYAGVQDKMNSSPGFLRQIFRHAVKTGRRYVLDYRRTGRRAPRMLSVLFQVYDHTVFALLKRVVGLRRGRVFPVAGAPLADHIAEFLLSVNFPIRYGYGLSETSATVCFYPQTHYVPGSIGRVMPGLQVRIDPQNNEILVKGKTVTSGYYQKPAETAGAFTPDGFFRTGDAGRLDGDTLYFVERIKDLFKTSNGKYIAPQAIELSVSGNKYIEQCVVIGDGYKFVSALIVPNFEALESYAQAGNISFDGNREALIGRTEILRLYESILEERQKNFASFEKIKRFTLLPEALSKEKGEITDTLKVRRRTVARNYAAQIEAMYNDGPDHHR